MLKKVCKSEEYGNALAIAVVYLKLIGCSIYAHTSCMYSTYIVYSIIHSIHTACVLTNSRSQVGVYRYGTTYTTKLYTYSHTYIHTHPSIQTDSQFLPMHEKSILCNLHATPSQHTFIDFRR